MTSWHGNTSLTPDLKTSPHCGLVMPYGPLARYVTFRVAHAPGMPGTFPPPPLVSDPDIHHGTCVTHVPWCMPGSLTSGFLWSRWRGKTFPTFPAHAQPRFCVSGKRPIVQYFWVNSGSGNGLIPDGIKPLPEPLLTYHQRGSVNTNAQNINP